LAVTNRKSADAGAGGEGEGLEFAIRSLVPDPRWNKEATQTVKLVPFERDFNVELKGHSCWCVGPVGSQLHKKGEGRGRDRYAPLGTSEIKTIRVKGFLKMAHGVFISKKTAESYTPATPT